VKLGVFAVLMVAAAVSRDVVNRRWRIPEDALEPRVPVGAGVAPGAAAVGPPPDADDEPAYPDGYVLEEPTAERRLRRSLLLEVLLSVVILAVTALLVNAAPARDLESGPFVTTLRTDEVSFEVTVTPAERGPNEMHLFTLDPSGGGGTIDATEVTAEMSQPANDIAPIEVELIRLAPGHYTSAGFTVPFAGDWELTVKAVIGDVDEATATATVPISS
jgi:copper transport protein